MPARKLIPLLFLLLSVILPCEAKEETPKTIVHRFFTLVYRREYKKAYAQFSESVKREVNFIDFKQGAQDVRYLKILEIKILDKEENLIKMKIRARLHLIYKEKLYDAIYEGHIDLYREEGLWKVLTVELEAKSQKPLNKKASDEKLQKLDFGTK